MVAASTMKASRKRLTANLRSTCHSAGLGSRRRYGLNQPGLAHPRRELRHHRKPLGAFHSVPARDLRKRTAAAEAEAGFGIDHTDCDARCFFAHSSIVNRFRWSAQALRLKSGAGTHDRFVAGPAL